jgi:hypothetical protein
LSGGRIEQLPGLIEQMLVGGSEQAVVTDFDEAFGQNVLKEAADELFGRDGRVSGLIRGGVLVGKVTWPSSSERMR